MFNTRVSTAVSVDNMPVYLRKRTKNPLINADTAAKNQNMVQMPNFYYHPVSFKKNYEVIMPDKIMHRLGHNDCSPKLLYDIGRLDEEESEKFIDEYCKHTGFPNLREINSRMRNHVVNTMEKSAKEAGTDVLWCGYHKECSVSHNLALPGSDLDASGAIITGSQDTINKFNNRIWNNYNPLLVSIRKDYEFPDVYTIDQLYEWTQVIDDIVKNSKMSEKTQIYSRNLKENKNFNKALEFNIDIADEIDNNSYSTDYFQKKAPSLALLMTYPGKTPKNITQSMSSVLESYRSGNTLIQKELSSEQAEKMQKIKQSALYKYGNLCMQEAEFKLKPKLQARRKYINEEYFNSLNTDEKKTLISKMIYESYPSWSKAKIMNLHKKDEMFDNGDDINFERTEAFNKTIDKT